jgi:hypothetical protein
MSADNSVKLPSDRSFALTFVVVFALLAGWQAWRGHETVATSFAVLGAVMLGFALVRPSLLHPLNRAWMKLGALLHHIVSPLVMGAIYFLVFTPVACVMRLAGRDVLRRKLDSTAQSYWIRRDPPGPPPDSLPNQF